MNDNLRALAERATPGPWYLTENSDEFGGDIVDELGDYVAVDREGLAGCVRSQPDAAYIAAANPAAILALLDERAEAAAPAGLDVERLTGILDAYPEPLPNSVRLAKFIAGRYGLREALSDG